MSKRFLNLTLALGLVAGLFVGVFGSASAETPRLSGNEWVFFPYVPNGDSMGDTGTGWYGTVTIQNLEDFPVRIDFGATSKSIPGPKFDTLAPHASKTYSADYMQVAAPGGGVSVRASWDFSRPSLVPFCAPTQELTMVDNHGAVNGFDPLSDQDIAQVLDVATVVNEGNADINDNGTPNDPLDDFIVSTAGPAAVHYTAGNDYTFRNNGLDWSPTGNEPPVGQEYYVLVIKYDNCVRGPEIGAVEKHIQSVVTTAADGTKTATAMNVVGQSAAANVAVDGYTGIPDEDVSWGASSAICADQTKIQLLGIGLCNGEGQYFAGVPIIPTFDGHSYLPIAQINNGWNTFIHVTNIDQSTGAATAAVTLTFYSAASQGAFGPSVGSFTAMVPQGQTATVDVKTWLAGQGITGDWFGSVWITSDYGVVANANRQKDITNMAITNTSIPSRWATTSRNSFNGPCGPLSILCLIGGLDSGNFRNYSGTGNVEMYAPLVFKNYNGWNMGFNIVNTAEITNTVTVTYVGPTGNVVGTDSVSIPAKAMEIIYVPQTQDLGLGGNTSGFIGAAVFSSQIPFGVAVDEVKYLGARQQGQGQAMSYIATDAGASCGGLTQLLGGPLNICRTNADTLFGDSPILGYPRLSLPLVQKMGSTGASGDTSGINLFNPDKNDGVTAWVNFYQPSGALGAPTLQSPYQIALGALNTATIYTPDLTEMSVGFQGSAQVVPVDGRGSIVGVSNNVNYAVNGDGSAVYNLLNAWGQFRFFCSQTNGAAVTECVRPG